MARGRNIAEGLTEALESIMRGYMTRRRLQMDSEDRQRQIEFDELRKARLNAEARAAATPTGRLNAILDDIGADQDAKANLHLAFADAGEDPVLAQRYIQEAMSRVAASGDSEFNFESSNGAGDTALTDDQRKQVRSLRQAMLALRKYMQFMPSGPSVPPQTEAQLVVPQNATTTTTQDPRMSMSTGTEALVRELLTTMQALRDDKLSAQDKQMAIQRIRQSLPVGGHTQATR